MNRLVLSLLIAGILLLGACGNLSPTTETPTPAPEPTFEPIVITGSGSMTSPPFMITTKEWVIYWVLISEHPGYEAFGFFVYPRGEVYPSGNFVEAVPLTDSDGFTYSYAGKGEYYVKVIAANIKMWRIVIAPPDWKAPE
jgi:hypothetical protein